MLRRRRSPGVGEPARAPLVVLLVLAAIQMLAWSLLLPPFQGPDEIDHVAYTQRLVETRSIPWFPNGEAGATGPPYSTELGVALDWVGAYTLQLNPAAHPPSSPVSFELWRAHDAPLSADDRGDGGFVAAMANPPLYYMYAAVPYAATTSLNIFDREFFVRLWNLPLLLVIVWFTWLIAGELFANRRWLQTLATAAVALNPQLQEMAATVNPDILLAAVWTAFFWLAISVLRRGLTWWKLAGLVALCIASSLTHGRGVAIVVPALFVVLGALWRRHRPARRAVIAAAGGALAVGAAAVFYLSAVYATSGDLSGSRIRQFGSYLWQFYLPRLGFLTPPPGPDWGAQQVFIDRFYGTYGALDVVFPPGAMSLVKWLSLIGIALAGVGLVSRWRRSRRAPVTVAVFAVAALAYMYLLHAAAFRSLLATGDPLITGRYLLPLIVVYALAIALAVSWLPRRASLIAAGLVTGGFCLLAIAALGLTFQRYYA